MQLGKGFCYFCLYDNATTVQERTGQRVSIPPPEALGRTMEELESYKQSKVVAQEKTKKLLASSETTNSEFVPTHKLSFTNEEREEMLKKFGFDPGVPPKFTKITSKNNGPNQAQLSFTIPAVVDPEAVEIVQETLTEWVAMLIRLITFGSAAAKPMEEVLFGRSNKSQFGPPHGEY